MADEKCTALLENLKKIKEEKLLFKRNEKLHGIMGNLTKEESSRLEKAKVCHTRIQKQYDSVRREVDDHRNVLSRLQRELNAANAECEQIKSCVNGSTVQPLKSESKLRSELEELKEQLEAHRQISGVRFAYGAREDVVSGFVGLKGETSKDTKLIPFFHKKSSDSITRDIWNKMEEAVGFASDDENIMDVC